MPGTQSKNRKRKANFNSTEDKTETTVNNEDDSNSQKPKKRNKKKTIDTQSGVPESKMSKRQMKREKHAQRVAEAEMASHKSVQTSALSYLSLWKHNRAEWKFNKVKQIWLHKHKFDVDKIPEELWQIFIEYFSASSGGIKKLLIEDSKKIIDEMDKWVEKNEEASNPETKPSEVSYQRARDLFQNIQE